MYFKWANIVIMPKQLCRKDFYLKKKKSKQTSDLHQSDLYTTVHYVSSTLGDEINMTGKTRKRPTTRQNKKLINKQIKVQGCYHLSPLPQILVCFPPLSLVCSSNHDRMRMVAGLICWSWEDMKQNICWSTQNNVYNVSIDFSLCITSKMYTVMVK